MSLPLLQLLVNSSNTTTPEAAQKAVASSDNHTTQQESFTPSLSQRHNKKKNVSPVPCLNILLSDQMASSPLAAAETRFKHIAALGDANHKYLSLLLTPQQKEAVPNYDVAAFNICNASQSSLASTDEQKKEVLLLNEARQSIRKLVAGLNACLRLADGTLGEQLSLIELHQTELVQTLDARSVELKATELALNQRTQELCQSDQRKRELATELFKESSTVEELQEQLVSQADAFKVKYQELEQSLANLDRQRQMEVTSVLAELSSLRSSTSESYAKLEQEHISLKRSFHAVQEELTAKKAAEVSLMATLGDAEASIASLHGRLAEEEIKQQQMRESSESLVSRFQLAEIQTTIEQEQKLHLEESLLLRNRRIEELEGIVAQLKQQQQEQQEAEKKNRELANNGASHTEENLQNAVAAATQRALIAENQVSLLYVELARVKGLYAEANFKLISASPHHDGGNEEFITPRKRSAQTIRSP